MSRTTKQRVPKRLGRPTPLNDHDRIDRLLDLLQQGNHATTSCAVVGLNPATLWSWLSIAQDAQHDLDEARADAAAEGRPEPAAGTVITAHQARCLEFSQRYARARAEAEAKVVRTIGKVIEGGHLISRKPALTGDGTPIYDEDGALVYEEVYAQPDGKLGLEFLSRSAPSRWGRQGPLEVEVSGKGGGPVQVESGVVVKALAERLAGTLALPAGAQGDLGEVVDGEIVDPDDDLPEQVRVSQQG